MSYPGGKNGAGVYQAIINQMPPHQTYIEGFLGSGAVLRMKKPAIGAPFPDTIQGLTSTSTIVLPSSRDSKSYALSAGSP